MRATIKIEYLIDATNDNRYGIGAEIYVAQELHKVASLYVTADSVNQALYQAIPRLLDEVPDGMDSVVYQSGCQRFIKKTKLENRFGILANDRGMKLYIQRKRINAQALLLADDAIKRQADCIAIIN